MDPRGSTRVPPRETAKEEDTPAAAAGESAPEPDGAQTPPPEDQEDARGGLPTPGIALGGDAYSGLRTAGSPPGAPDPHVRVVGVGPPILAAPLPHTTWTALGLSLDLRTKRVGRLSGPRVVAPSLKRKRGGGVWY